MMLRPKVLRQLYAFYSTYALPSLIFTAASVYMVMLTGTKSLAAACWMKAACTAVLVLYVQQYKKKEFFYYRNLGYSIRLMWTLSLGADLLLFCTGLYFSL